MHTFSFHLRLIKHKSQGILIDEWFLISFWNIVCIVDCKTGFHFEFTYHFNTILSKLYWQVVIGVVSYSVCYKWFFSNSTNHAAGKFTFHLIKFMMIMIFLFVPVVLTDSAHSMNSFISKNAQIWAFDQIKWQQTVAYIRKEITNRMQ